jgi:hypothetical protein
MSGFMDTITKPITKVIAESAGGLGLELDRIIRMHRARHTTWKIQGNAIQVMDRDGKLIAEITNA